VDAAESMAIKILKAYRGPAVVAGNRSMEGLVIDVLESGLYDLAALPVA